jgi:hypothetical protein
MFTLQLLKADYPERTQLAKPSQIANCGADICAKRMSTSCSLLAIPASLGAITFTLTLRGEYSYANDFRVRLKALTDLDKD